MRPRRCPFTLGANVARAAVLSLSRSLATSFPSHAPSPRRYSKTRWWRAVLLGFTAYAACASAFAQVNVEPLRSQLKERGQAINVRMSVAGQQGNTNGVQLSSGAFYGLSSEQNLFYLQVSGDYGHTNRVTQVAKAFAHGRYNRRLYSWLLGEVFAQWESDRFRRVQSRELFGTGPRFEITRHEDFDVVYGASYMLEVTKRTDFIEASQRHTTYQRLNNYGTFMYRIHDQVTLAETFYYQPRFADPTDYWLLSVFSATFQVTPVLSSGLNFTIRHESNAPTPIKKTDAEVISSLNLTF
jgi:Protein of unknown function, DUF481